MERRSMVTLAQQRQEPRLMQVSTTYLVLRQRSNLIPQIFPTQQSLAAVTKEVAGTENQPESSVNLAYYKTSDTDTAALDAFLKAALDRQAQNKTPRYYVGFRDCINFCMAGMQSAGVGRGPAIGSLPNITIGLFAAWADVSYSGAIGKRKFPKEDTTSTFHPCSTGDTSPGCSQ